MGEIVRSVVAEVCEGRMAGSASLKVCAVFSNAHLSPFTSQSEEECALAHTEDSRLWFRYYNVNNSFAEMLGSKTPSECFPGLLSEQKF